MLKKEKLQIVTYRGYGTSTRLLLRGRVLKEKIIVASSEKDNLWRNLANMYRRFQSDEIPFARVRVTFQNVVQEVTADKEGYFGADLPLQVPLQQENNWYQADTVLLEPPPGKDDLIHSKAFILIPSSKARFGVISDLDDTVIQTGATSVLKMIRTVLLSNARTRLPFRGIAAFYRALQEAAPSGSRNPLFYVSSSPWNLYDLLTEFLELQKIPLGPVLLRDWGVSGRDALPMHHHTHKLTTVRTVLDTYPELPFILVGDSGQDDPSIYGEIAQQYPGRIPVIYIREVGGNKERLRAISEIAEKVKETGTSFLLVPDTLSAAKHATEQGWIPQYQVADY